MATSLPTFTETPTQQISITQDTPIPPLRHLCDGLDSEIEVRIILPYAAAADLDPVAVGYVPLNVNTEEGSYMVEGAGYITYDKTQTWTDEDGKETAEVFLEMDVNN